MRDIWLVIKHDIAATVRQRSFWILTLLMPALLLAWNAYYVIQDNGLANTTSEEDNNEETTGAPADGLPALGLVDEAGLIAGLPPGFPPDLFVPYPDLGQAQAGLEAGAVVQVVHVPADHLLTGEVTIYTRDFQILSSGAGMGLTFNSQDEWVLRYLIDYNLTGEESLATALRDPVPGRLARFHPLAPPEAQTASDRTMAEIVAAVLPYVFYFLLLMSSNYLMRSVVAEKENRTVEVLLLSLSPRRLMTGKILAMSFVVLVQLVFWVGSGAWLLQRGAQALSVSSFSFPPGFFLWAGLFLVLGYLLFAAVMAAGGALATNIREVSQMTFLLVIPLLPTLMFGSLFLEEPDSPLVLFLSLFPFSAPSAMVTRLAVGEVPLWQVAASLGGLALTAYLFVQLSARFFQVGNLLSGTEFSWRRLVTGWKKV